MVYVIGLSGIYDALDDTVVDGVTDLGYTISSKINKDMDKLILKDYMSTYWFEDKAWKDMINCEGTVMSIPKALQGDSVRGIIISDEIEFSEDTLRGLVASPMINNHSLKSYIGEVGCLWSVYIVNPRLLKTVSDDEHKHGRIVLFFAESGDAVEKVEYVNRISIYRTGYPLLYRYEEDSSAKVVEENLDLKDETFYLMLTENASTPLRVLLEFWFKNHDDGVDLSGLNESLAQFMKCKSFTLLDSWVCSKLTSDKPFDIYVGVDENKKMIEEGITVAEFYQSPACADCDAGGFGLIIKSDNDDIFWPDDESDVVEYFYNGDFEIVFSE